MRQFRDKIAGMTLEAAITLAMIKFGLKKAGATFLVIHALNFFIPTYTEMELDAIIKAGNLKSDGTMANGIKISSVTTCSSSPAGIILVMLNTYESWESGYMEGGVRYRGTFDTSDHTPLWRYFV